MHDEHDPFEYARLLQESEDLGRSDFSEPRGISRRELLKRGAVGAAAVSGAGALAGTAAAQTSKSGKFTGSLRVITLGVEFPTPEVAARIKQDLGFSVAITATDPVTEAQKAITAPETFDVFGGYNYQDIQVWSSGNLLPVDTTKIHAWPQPYKLFAWGKGHPASKEEAYGDANAPFRALFLKQGTSGLPLTKEAPGANKDIVQWIDEKTGKPRTSKMPRYIVGTPAHFNADSIGYNDDVINKTPTRGGGQRVLNTKWKARG